MCSNYLKTRRIPSVVEFVMRCVNLKAKCMRRCMYLGMYVGMCVYVGNISKATYWA